MILVDTSIWIDHLRAGNERLSALLVAGQVLSHPFVIGELALGNLVHRTAVIGAMQDLPQIRLATEAEVLHAIITRHWYGQGIGYTDAHLLAAALLTHGSSLWTHDKRLHAAASRLGVADNISH